MSEAGRNPTEVRRERDVEDDPWQTLADNRDVLEMVIEEDVPFAHRAQRLLDELDERGY